MSNFDKNTNIESFGTTLKSLRLSKKYSQMDLSLDIGISTKHLSFLETGRSNPSRKIILSISKALKLNLQQTNNLLTKSGFSNEYSKNELNSNNMKVINDALFRILDKHDPYPAIVLNSSYDILLLNKGFKKVLNYFLNANIISKNNNLYQIIFHKEGLWQYFENWDLISYILISRILEEANTTNNSYLFNLYNEIKHITNNKKIIEIENKGNLPILNFTLTNGNTRLSFFSTITNFGSPIDITTQEIRIESLFPLDNETKDFLLV